MSNLTVRLLTAVVGIPLVVAATLAGGWWFFALMMIIGLLGLREFGGLAKAKGASPQRVTGILLACGIGTVFIFDRFRYALLSTLDFWGVAVPFPSMFQWFVILLLLFVPGMGVIELFRNRGSALLNLSATLLGALYVSFFAGCVVGLRELFIPADFPVHLHFPLAGPTVPDEIAGTIYRWGGWTVLTVFASIWICDSAAYFAGRAFGRHRLFERVSPKKTWEGAAAGFLASVATFVAAREFALPYLALRDAAVCGVIIGVFGQLGDLFESLLKRDAGVKDSSALIPGHGGMLDRFDSLLFVAPLLYLYLDFIVF
jgi:phosphatidate cytidylyltransferase